MLAAIILQCCIGEQAALPPHRMCWESPLHPTGNQQDWYTGGSAIGGLAYQAPLYRRRSDRDVPSTATLNSAGGTNQRMGRMQAGLCTQSCARKHQREATACDPAASQPRSEHIGKRFIGYQSHFPFTASTARKSSCQRSMFNIKLFEAADKLSS